MNIEHLSTDLHLYLASFLAYGDKISFGSCCLSLCHDLLFNHLRRVDVHGLGNWWPVESYKELRERLAKCVLSPERQYHVTVRRNDILESFPFRKIYSLHTDFDEFTTYLVRDIQKIYRLELEINFLDLFSEIIIEDDYGIKSLIVSNKVDEVVSFPLIPPPSSLEYLELNGPFSTISPAFVNAFVHLQELSLRGVESINNIHVRMFVNIPKIKLDTCENIDDITPLQSNRDVSISTCRGIVDYRNAFTYSLRITIHFPDPDALIDLNCFKAVQNLDISLNENQIRGRLPLTLKRLTIGKNISHYENLADLQEVTIEFSSTAINLQSLCCVPILTLSYLKGVDSLHGLGYDEDRSKCLGNRKVVIRSLDSVKDFSPLNTIETVEISYCDKFHDLGQVRDVKYLTVKCWTKIKPTAPMMCEKLTLSGEINENLFIYLPNVKELGISDVYGDEVRSLEGFENLKNLERITISQSWEAQDTKGWKMLFKDYFIFDILPKPLPSYLICVKKIK